MLILTRKVGESVLIGDDISITVLSVRETKLNSVLKRLKKYPFTEKKFTNELNKRKMNPI